MRQITTRLAALAAILAVSACTTMAPGDGSDAEVTRLSTSSTYSDQDFQCLLEAIYHEAAADSIDGQRAVANVILNRAEDPRFPNSVCGVVADGQAQGRCQFSYRCDGRPEVFADKVKLQTATQATTVVLANPEEDVTNGALFFHAGWMKPGWFASLRRTVALGGNIFYR
ncbi:cell wall hydrolase [Halovulum dunhuangense]|uniref:Cell wall hydrolase n=1 Tax=Halovulum dunhuangense TaxID=1505036 RepID=A0A849L589_9RHOB|nr:cell wall hydrolase [Halovulum dunhuangense]NNU81287.1 cell wall hydrolase [Halovulum dunhuangense]